MNRTVLFLGVMYLIALVTITFLHVDIESGLRKQIEQDHIFELQLEMAVEQGSC